MSHYHIILPRQYQTELFVRLVRADKKYEIRLNNMSQSHIEALITDLSEWNPTFYIEAKPPIYSNLAVNLLSCCINPDNSLWTGRKNLHLLLFFFNK